jgi:hypothetical protein
VVSITHGESEGSTEVSGSVWRHPSLPSFCVADGTYPSVPSRIQLVWAGLWKWQLLNNPTPAQELGPSGQKNGYTKKPILG